MLEKYLQKFAKLRTDRGRERYPEITHELGSEQDKDLKLCYKSRSPSMGMSLRD